LVVSKEPEDWGLAGFSEFFGANSQGFQIGYGTNKSVMLVAERKGISIALPF
jgi:hypothetical protein